MSQYKAGTASVTNGSQIVTGSGTAWLANAAVGNSFKLFGVDTHYTIAAVNNDTQITLNAVWAGSTLSNQNYEISRDFTPNLNLHEPSVGDAEVMYHITQSLRGIDSALGQNVNPTSSPTFASLMANFFANDSSLGTMTIPSGQNNMSVGPLTVTGTITVNGRWLIL